MSAPEVHTGVPIMQLANTTNFISKVSYISGAHGGVGAHDSLQKSRCFFGMSEFDSYITQCGRNSAE